MKNLTKTWLKLAIVGFTVQIFGLQISPTEASALVPAEQACSKLLAQIPAQANGTIACKSDSTPETLIVHVGSPDLLARIRAAILSSQNSFLGYAVRFTTDENHPSKDDALTRAAINNRQHAQSFAQTASVLNSIPTSVNFDHSASRSGSVNGETNTELANLIGAELFQGPPGGQPNQGPPGGQPKQGPPGGQPNQGPPGGQPSQGQPNNSPAVQDPPAQPIPVLPAPNAPPPDWWNTNFKQFTLWDFALTDLGEQKCEHLNSAGTEARCWSSWYPRSDLYLTTDGNSDSFPFSRELENQGAHFSHSLVSRKTTWATRCWYQAQYHFELEDTGLGGYAWKSDFEGYQGACLKPHIQAQNEYKREVGVQFNMGDKSLTPWEKENFRVTLDANGNLSISQDGAFNYSIQKADSVNPADESIKRTLYTLIPGKKVFTDPHHDGVVLKVTTTGSGFKFSVIDWWTDYYDKGQSESLDLYFTISKGLSTVYKETRTTPRRLSTYRQQGIQKSTGGSEHPAVFDVPSRTPLKPGKYTIEWGFRRAGSSISNGNWIEKGSFTVQN